MTKADKRASTECVHVCLISEKKGRNTSMSSAFQRTVKYGVLGALALIWTFRGSSKKRLEDSASESKRTQRIQVEIRLTKAV